MVERYPNSLRLPEYNPYQLEVDMGVIRTPIKLGFSRQRRRYMNMPTVLSMKFVMTWKQLRSWQRWWDTYAYTWFEMPAVTMYSAQPTQDCDIHLLRCIGDLRIEALSARGYCSVTCQCEIDPDYGLTIQPPQPPQPSSGNWIVGGVAPSPSPDWYIARTAGNPAVDWVNSGTPSAPSAIV